MTSPVGQSIGSTAVSDLITQHPGVDVYAGTETRRARPVWVQMLQREPGFDEHDPDVAEAFLDRARSFAAVDERTLIRVASAGTTPEGDPYVITEAADRGTLQRRLGVGDGATDADLERVAGAAGGALAALHRQGVTHEALSTEKVLLVTGPNQLDALPGTLWSDEYVRIDTPGVVPRLADASDRFAAPEQLAGYGASAATDIYRLSGVLAEMAAGRPRRSGERWVDLLDDVSVAGRPALAGALARGLSADPEFRQQSAEVWQNEVLPTLDAAPGRGVYAGGRPLAAGASGTDAAGAGAAARSGGLGKKLLLGAGALLLVGAAAVAAQRYLSGDEDTAIDQTELPTLVPDAPTDADPNANNGTASGDGTDTGDGTAGGDGTEGSDGNDGTAGGDSTEGSEGSDGTAGGDSSEDPDGAAGGDDDGDGATPADTGDGAGEEGADTDSPDPDAAQEGAGEDGDMAEGDAADEGTDGDASAGASDSEPATAGSSANYDPDAQPAPGPTSPGSSAPAPSAAAPSVSSTTTPKQLAPGTPRYCPPSQPHPVEGLEVVQVTDQTASIHWQPVDEYFNVYVNDRFHDTVIPGADLYVVEGLDPMTQYTIVIAEENKKSAGSAVCAQTRSFMAPGAIQGVTTPKDLRVTAQSATTLTISWDPAPIGVEHTIHLVGATSGSQRIATLDSGVSSYTFINLVPNKSYEFFVRALDGSNRSGKATGSGSTSLQSGAKVFPAPQGSN